jgi:hypothetical protein
VTTPLRKRVGLTPLLPPLTRRRTSSKPTAQKEPTLKRQVVEFSSSLIFLALRVPSEPTKLLGTTPGDTLTTQTTRLLSNKPYYHRVPTEAEQKAFEEEAPKVIQAYTKPKEEDLAPAEGDRDKISKIRFGKNLYFRLEDNRPAPIRSIQVGEGLWGSNLPNIIRYTKIRYQEWLFAGG